MSRATTEFILSRVTLPTAIVFAAIGVPVSEHREGPQAPRGSRVRAVTGEELRLLHTGITLKGLSWAPLEVGFRHNWLDLL